MEKKETWHEGVFRHEERVEWAEWVDWVDWIASTRTLVTLLWNVDDKTLYHISPQWCRSCAYQYQCSLHCSADDS